MNSKEAALAHCFTAGFYASDMYNEVRDELDEKIDIQAGKRKREDRDFRGSIRVLGAKIQHIEDVSKACIDGTAHILFDETIALMNTGDFKGAMKAWLELGTSEFKHILIKAEKIH
jgi:hypothetical protein